MIIVFVLATGLVVGISPGLLSLDRLLSANNIFIGIVGALVGAFVGLGDAPLFLEYSFLNEKTLMVAVSILFVFVKVSVTRNRIAP